VSPLNGFSVTSFHLTACVNAACNAPMADRMELTTQIAFG
jgi:hypothetical protein